MNGLAFTAEELASLRAADAEIEAEDRERRRAKRAARASSGKVTAKARAKARQQAETEAKALAETDELLGAALAVLYSERLILFTLSDLAGAADTDYTRGLSLIRRGVDLGAIVKHGRRAYLLATPGQAKAMAKNGRRVTL